LSGLAWTITAVAALLLVLAPAVRSETLVYVAIVLLGSLLLLRHDARLLLAPAYGAVLVLEVEFGARAVELRAIQILAPAALGARFAAVCFAALVGACAAAGTAAAVTVAPGRSVLLTGLGSLALFATFAGVVRAARCRVGHTSVEPRSVEPGGGEAPRAR
jgi:hypothetical protein